MPYPKRTMLEKYQRWVTVGEPDECWLFHGKATSKGYGLLTWREGGKSRAVLCHRWAYAHFVGPIPEGGLVLHSCDTPLCCNPSHLRVGSLSDNMRDMVERKRSPRLTVTHCPQGHEYNEENTRWRGNHRQCRQCDRDMHYRSYHRKKEEWSEALDGKK